MHEVVRIRGSQLTEVEEELRNNIAGKDTIRTNLVVAKANDAEHDGKHGESQNLDRLAADGIDESNRDPVTRNSASAYDDEVANRSLVEDLVDVGAARVANGGENDRVVERETIKGDIKKEPRACRSEQDFAMLPLAVVVDEVTERGLGDLKLASVVAHACHTLDLVGNALGLAGKVGFGVGSGLNHITRNVKGVSWSVC